MILALIILSLGLVALIAGAEFFVGGAAGIARRYKVSELVIGLTIVSMGTSAPELIVNVFAALEGRTGLAFGNVIGSNNINLFVILGIAGLITPLAVQRPTVLYEIPFSGFAALLLGVLVYDGFSDPAVFSRIDAAVCLLFFSLFMYYAWRSMKYNIEPTAATAAIEAEKSDQAAWLTRALSVLPRPLREPLLLLGGLGLLVLGGRLVVDQAVFIAAQLGLSERIIGLTVVALGTSLPELATSVVAGLRGKADIAVGNVVGSNLFNLLFVLGLTGLVIPLPYERSFDRELLLLLAGTVAVFAMMFIGKRHRLQRWQAGLLLLAYALYTGLVTLQA